MLKCFGLYTMRPAVEGGGVAEHSTEGHLSQGAQG